MGELPPLPIEVYTNRKLILKVFLFCIFLLCIGVSIYAYLNLHHYPRSYNFLGVDDFKGYRRNPYFINTLLSPYELSLLLMVPSGLLSLILLKPLLVKKKIFSMTDQGIQTTTNPVIPWSEINQVKPVSVGPYRLVGIFLKNKDIYLVSLTSSEKRKAETIEKYTGTPVVVDLRTQGIDDQEAGYWIEQYRKMYGSK